MVQAKHKMKSKSKQKSKATSKRPPIEGSWSTVKIAGNLITNDGGGLEGLVGLEVLENYDNNIIAKAKVTETIHSFESWCLTVRFIDLQKSKKREREDAEDELTDDKPKVKQNKKQKTNNAVSSAPGRYVLVNADDDDEADDTAEKEDSDEIDATDLIVRQRRSFDHNLKLKKFSFSISSNGRQSEFLI